VYAVLTAWLFRALLPALTQSVPAGADYPLYLWNVWWVHRALLVEHVSPYATSWIFYPEGVSLLYHTMGVAACLPFLPLVALGGVPGIVLSHNLAILSSFALCGLAVYLLAFDEARSRLGALVAGVVFAFCSDRLATLGWTSLLSAHFLVFYVLFLLRALRGQRRSAVAAALFLALVWYNELTHAAFALLLTLALAIWQGPLRRRVLATVGAVAAGAALLVAPLLWELYETEFVQDVEWIGPSELQIDRGGADPRFFLLPRHTRSALHPPLEAAFPDTLRSARAAADARGSPFVPASLGLSLLVLVAVAAWRGQERRRWGWLALGLAALVLSLGPHLRLGDRLYEGFPLPYALLRDLPGFAMSKAHQRFVLPGLLCLSVFAAFGVAGVARPRAGEPGRSRWLRRGLAALLVAAVLGEYAGAAPRIAGVRAPSFAQALADDPGDYAVLHYPRIPGIAWLELEMWGQVIHEKRLLTGFVARSHRIPGLQEDPSYSIVEDPARRIDVPSQLERLDRLLREPRYRVKYLLVSGLRLAALGSKGSSLLDALRERYELVAEEAARPASGRPIRSWLFYVGGAAFEAEARQLVRLAAELAAAPDGPADPERQRRIEELRGRWEAFRDGAASRERNTPLFREVAAGARAVLGEAFAPPRA
jgi:hypothetical protein